MRFVVYGAGAVGGVVGALLHQSGHDVVLVARSAHYEAIRTRGLRLVTPEQDVTLDVPVVSHPGDLSLTGDDAVLLGMKSNDTPAALDALALSASPDVAVVCLQNGVANERAALRYFARVYGVMVMTPTDHLEPGVVRAYSAPITGILDVGRFPAGADETARAIAAALEKATFSSVVRDDVMAWKYGKLLANLANAVEAVCGADAGSGELSRLAVDEGRAVLTAAGIEPAFDADPGTRGLRMQRVAGERRGGGSSWQSLARGTRRVESDYLNGEIVLLGRLHDVPTPVNAFLQRLARQEAAAGRPPGSVSEVDALAALRR